ncbi:MAG: serine/threonine-protein phosphatase, partial [Lachnospiraceae bacterium]|nr:serine/threonine-protein phosphatase [Lachnospiraceae bacterium]
EGMEYEEGSFRLEKGDTLYLYTDGVNEALNPQEELYGDDRLEENLSSAENVAMPLEQLVESILTSIKEFADGAEQADDITMLALRRNK